MDLTGRSGQGLFFPEGRGSSLRRLKRLLAGKRLLDGTPPPPSTIDKISSSKRVRWGEGGSRSWKKKAAGWPPAPGWAGPPPPRGWGGVGSALRKAVQGIPIPIPDPRQAAPLRPSIMGAVGPASISCPEQSMTENRFKNAKKVSTEGLLAGLRSGGLGVKGTKIQGPGMPGIPSIHMREIEHKSILGFSIFQN